MLRKLLLVTVAVASLSAATWLQRPHLPGMAAVGMAGAGAVDGDPAGVEAGGPAGELGGAQPGEALVGDGAAPGAGVGLDRALLWRQDFTAVDVSFGVWSPARGVHAGFWSIGAGDRKARPLDPRPTVAARIEQQPDVVSHS